MVGDWQECKCPKGKRERVVKCVRPTGEGEGEVDVIPDRECIKPKPKVKEKCRCDMVQTETMDNYHRMKKRLLLDKDSDPLKPGYNSVSISLIYYYLTCVSYIGTNNTYNHPN